MERKGVINSYRRRKANTKKKLILLKTNLLQLTAC